jgi:hypothetical protein
MPSPALAAAERPSEFGRLYSGYALALLTTVGVFNVADRFIIGLLLQPIANDLGLSDSQLGLFSGPAFGSASSTHSPRFRSRTSPTTRAARG